jgi:hypothetical protein
MNPLVAIGNIWTSLNGNKTALVAACQLFLRGLEASGQIPLGTCESVATLFTWAYAGTLGHKLLKWSAVYAKQKFIQDLEELVANPTATVASIAAADPAPAGPPVQAVKA